MKTMHKGEAIIALLRDARAERRSSASLARVLRALRALDVTPVERSAVLYWLDYVDEDNEPLKY